MVFSCFTWYSMDISALTFNPSFDGKFNLTSLFTVLVGIFTRMVVKGFIKAGPGDTIFPFNLPNFCLTPTSPGFTIAQEVKMIDEINR